MKSRLFVAAPALVVALALTGCSANNDEKPAATPSESSQQDSSQQATDAPAEPAEPEAQTPTVDSVIATLGITDFATGETAPFTTSYGSGTFEGTRAQIYDFPNEEAFNSFVEMLSSMGITADSFARSGTIAVSVDDATKLDAVKGLLG